MMPPDVARKTYEAHKEFYDGLQTSVSKATAKLPDPDTMLSQVTVDPRIVKLATKFKPAVLLISGCQDNQTSLDGAHNGAFTEQLLKVWSTGAFKGTYVTFHAQIKAGLPASQTPNLFALGAAAAFKNQQPFTV